jgi:putative endonuclease
MPESRRIVGQLAENVAAEHLLNLGYTIITRNYHVRGGEIDLVAMDGDEVVFVEVKYRSRSRPEEALGQRKSSRLRRAALAYLGAFGNKEAAYRFDLIAIEGRDVRHHIRVEIGE